MKYKRIIGNGLAFEPAKDMELFRTMANKGYHLCGLGGLLSYKFEEGEPKDYIFSYTAVKKPDDDYVSYFTDTGWEPVIVQPNLQIFKALPGTDPIYTDKETLKDFYKEQITKFTKHAIWATLIFAIACFISSKLPNNTLSSIIFITAMIPFVFTVMPLFGFIYHYKKS